MKNEYVYLFDDWDTEEHKNEYFVVKSLADDRLYFTKRENSERFDVLYINDDKKTFKMGYMIFPHSVIPISKYEIKRIKNDNIKVCYITEMSLVTCNKLSYILEILNETINTVKFL